MVDYKEVERLESEFSALREKQLDFSNFLHIAINDDDFHVRMEALHIIESFFPVISDKQRAYEDLIKRLVSDRGNEIGYRADNILFDVFSQVPDKGQALNDFEILATNEDYFIRSSAVSLIATLFSQLPDKEKAWNILHRLVCDNESLVRWGFLYHLESMFPHIPDKKQACEDLHKLTYDEYYNTHPQSGHHFEIRAMAASTLGPMFPKLLDKEQAFEDLHRLINDKDNSVRCGVIGSMGFAFPHLPDTFKQLAWEDIHKLILDEASDVRGKAAKAIGSAFQYLPDTFKQPAWEDMHKLILDETSGVREEAAMAIGSAFQYLPDKQQAWDDLHGLTYDDSDDLESEIWGITSAIVSAFPHLPDKQQAWDDLNRFAITEWEVRDCAIEALGSVFVHLPNKAALNDLYKLTEYGDEEMDGDIRAYAYYSLGNISLFNASNCQNISSYENELEKAIALFEKSREEWNYQDEIVFNLCLFRALQAMLFNQPGVKEELNKNLGCLKSIIQIRRADECRKSLFRAIENLSTAFKQVQYLENKGFSIAENEIRFYRKYFDQAEEFMRNTKEELPFVTEALRKGMLILDGHLEKKLSKHLLIS